MQVDLDGFSVVELDRGHFGSAKNHNRMLYRTDFWEKFVDYEYVLMYHLDALVFSDQLQEWCDRGLDYIGSPFLQCADAPWVRVERVGNGGFALYRVPSVLKVLWKRYAIIGGRSSSSASCYVRSGRRCRRGSRGKQPHPCAASCRRWTRPR
jgi:Protein of unknown function (DUF5672)